MVDFLIIFSSVIMVKRVSLFGFWHSKTVSHFGNASIM